MKYAADFYRYRGDGTNAAGETVETEGERGRYLADEELTIAVNTAIAVEQPLLVTGAAGTGKTVLAYSIAAELELGDVEVFTVRSDHRGSELLYSIDNMQRFYDAQVKDPRARDRANYRELGPLARAFEADHQKVVLIDEIDKAPRDFPNDLLHALDRMEILIPELGQRIRAKHRPIIVITSNRESQLPMPFLRRCVFHHLAFPDRDRLIEILGERLGYLELAENLTTRIVAAFGAVRGVEGLEKKPSTGEMLAWAKVLHRAGVQADDLDGELAATPFAGALLKVEEDLAKLKGMAR